MSDWNDVDLGEKMLKCRTIIWSLINGTGKIVKKGELDQCVAIVGGQVRTLFSIGYVFPFQ